MFVDSHCHLDGPRFQKDRDQVLARAQEVGVEAMLVIGNGEGPDDVDCALKLAESVKEGPAIYATVGIHPHEARLAKEEHYARMEQLARNPKVIAWGEMGLDYYYDHSPREIQQQVFVRQMELARAAGLPIIIHCRPSENSEDSWTDCLRLIREHWSGSGLGGVLHCFTGEESHARTALVMGFVISFAGNLTYPKAENIRRVAKVIPMDRMFIETDSPYLAPIPHRGKRNEPAFVVETARQIGELRGMDREEVGRMTSENFYRFFDISLTNPLAVEKSR
ncbi:MAG TPA: TatD family hydrolase [Terriglobales bacterium]|nr:TatD family hydrolase [Terriglobales bacterium]